MTPSASVRLKSVVVVGCLVCSVSGSSLIAQSTTALNAKARWTPQRTADGHVDLEGIWNFATITPVERPFELGDREFLTPSEAADVRQRLLAQRNHDRRDTIGTEADVSRAYNQFWYEYGTNLVPTLRTSLILKPSTGRMPTLTASAQTREQNRADARRLRPADGPEDRNIAERCILGFNSGPPLVPSEYNNNIQIVQSRAFIVIYSEMIHDARTVPLDGRPHLPNTVRQWMGDPRGHWDGDTLVIESTNFSNRARLSYDPGNAVGKADENLRLVERFTRVADETLVYEFIVEDPTTWQTSWTAQIPMTKSSGTIYEYACHEGNYAMGGMLRAARAADKALVQK